MPQKTHQAGRETQWWFVEAWKDGRELFKALVEHVFAFLLLIGTLILFHYIFKFLDLPPERKEILEAIDFWGIAAALVIFGLSFLYKLVHDAVQRAKKKIQAERLLRLRMEEVLTAESSLTGNALDTFIDRELSRMETLAKSR
jgi:hypothetical protein